VTVLHPLLEAEVRSAIESEASRHFGRSWVADGFTDLVDQASHPCGLLHHPGHRSVFAKLSHDRTDGEQFQAELNGLTLLRQRARVVTPTPIGRGVIQLDNGSLLLFEALSERTSAARTRDDWRSIGLTLGLPRP
jgi:hypothetical protein